MAELNDGIIRGSELEQLIKTKLKVMDNVDGVFLDSIQDTQNAILRRVNGLLSKFDTENGRLMNTETNRTLLIKLRKDVKRIVRQSSYNSKIDAYLRNFDTITDLTEKIHLVGNDLKLSKISINPLKQEAIDNVVKGLSAPDSIDIGFEKYIRDTVFNAVTLNQGVVETRKQLSDLIAGTPTKHGQLERWVGQIARDAINNYDGQINAQIAVEYELNAYRYVGSLIKDSRPQCVRWVNKQVLKVEDMQKEIDWAENNGSGFNTATTVENFAIYRGGYNCRHAAIPFRLVEKKQ